MGANWTDLVDPSPEELLEAVGRGLDPESIELLARPAGDGRDVRPLLEGHGGYVVAVLAHPLAHPGEGRVEYLELDVVATPTAVVTVRKTGPRGDVAPVTDAVHRIACPEGEGNSASAFSEAGSVVTSNASRPRHAS